MKRRIDETALRLAYESLEPSQIDDIRRQYVTLLDELYTRKASPYTETFFTEGEDIFTQHILSRLSHTENLNAILRLRLVNRQWQRRVDEVRHLNFSAHSWGNSVYNYLLKHNFKHVTSIRSHRTILCNEDGSFARDHAFLRITHLEIDPPKDNDTAKYKLNVSGWTSLKTLICPRVNHELLHLNTLTQLTRLEVEASAFRDDPSVELEDMTKLQHLVIRYCEPDLDLSAMRSLRYLDSDRASHFRHFTGRGKLQFDDAEEDDDEAYRIERETKDRYQAGCWNGRFDGEWVAGVFTGEAHFQFDGDEMGYDGGFVNGKRHGYGKEYDNHSGYKGQWVDGKRHGTGAIYTLNRYGWDDETTLQYSGVWKNGVLLEETKIDA